MQLGINISLCEASGTRHYVPEASAFFKRLPTSPSSARKAVINNLIKVLKAANSVHTGKSVWDSLDALILCAATSAGNGLINLKGNFSNGTAINSPAFTVDRGFTSNSNGYIDTNFNPSINGTNYKQNDACFFIYLNTNQVNSTYEWHGNYSSGGTIRTLIGRPNGADENYRLAVNSGLSNFGSTDRLTGLYTAVRDSSSHQCLYVGNTLKLDASTSSSTGLLNSNLYILCYANGFFENDRVAAYGFGAGLTAADVAVLNNIITNYLTSIGAQ
jgi:hypothetical protein